MYSLTPEAELDLLEIWSYIAQDYVIAADCVEEEFYRIFLWLVEHPYAGHLRSDLTLRPVRFWDVPRYRNCIVVYDLPHRRSRSYAYCMAQWTFLGSSESKLPCSRQRSKPI